MTNGGPQEADGGSHWKVAGPLGATVQWDLLQVKTLLETGSPPTTPPGQLSGQTRSVTRTAASRDAGANDLLVGDVLRTNQLQERR